MFSRKGVVSPSTIVFYNSKLKKLLEILGNVYIQEIDITMLRQWRSSLMDKTLRYENHNMRDPIPGGYSLWTIHQHIRTIKQFFRFMYLEGYLSNNPAKTLEQVQLPSWEAKGISKQDRDKMIESARDQINLAAAARDYAIMLFIADTGCRRSGCAFLKLDDLDLDTRRAYIWEKGKGGLHKSRPVFFIDKTKLALQEWLKFRGDIESDYVFISLRGKDGISPATINSMFKKTAYRVGVKKRFHPHQWRHGTIRAWLEAGMPLPTASQLAGHTTTKITGDIYGIVSEAKLRSEHEKYSWV